MGDIQAMIAALPPWAQAAAQFAVFLLTVGIGWKATRHGKRRDEGDDDDADAHHDAALILAADPVKAGLSALVELGANARLQTEALKTIAAAHTAYAKLVEPDFLELRIFKMVQDQLREERRNRGA